MDENNKTIIEGILFAMGEPVEVNKIAYALDKDIKTTSYLLDDFMNEYNERNSGMKVIKIDNSYQMTTNPEIFSYLIKVAKQPKKFQLTQAVLETLSIIAFKQPVTKGEIEKIRGVNSDYAVNKLLEYELIFEVGRSETIGRPILFETTKKFLRLFGLSNLQDLKDSVDVNEVGDGDDGN